MVRSLESEQVRELDDDGAFDELTAVRIADVVVHDVEIAQWAVRPVETDVRADSIRGSVVLDERVEKRVWAEAVNESRTCQIRRKAATG